MTSTSYFDFSPIYALATPYGKSAIAVFRTSGDGTIENIKKVFSNKKKLKSVTKTGLVYGYIIDSENGEKVDEVVLSVFKEGHGYTREEAVEISTHGSLAVINRISRVLEKAGFRKAEGGEFSFRAFRNGALSLTEAEAVLDIIESTSDKSRAIALKSREGNLDYKIKEVYEKLVDLSGFLELQVDYSEDEYDEDVSFPQDEVDDILSILGYLKSNHKVSTVLKGGINVALVGNTNAGKSTLFNTLLKTNRSIVSSEKGTTRDFIKESIEIDGTLINFYDTAGLNDEASGIEKIGIDRTHDIKDKANIVLHLIPKDEVNAICSSNGITLSDTAATVITIITKDDLDIKITDGCKKALSNENAIFYSDVTKSGFDQLLNALKDAIKTLTNTNLDGELLMVSTTTENAVEKAYNAIKTLDEHTPIEASTNAVREAIYEIGTLLGKENPTEEILDSLFSRFCVGK